MVQPYNALRVAANEADSRGRHSARASDASARQLYSQGQLTGATVAAQRHSLTSLRTCALRGGTSRSPTGRGGPRNAPPGRHACRSPLHEPRGMLTAGALTSVAQLPQCHDAWHLGITADCTLWLNRGTSRANILITQVTWSPALSLETRTTTFHAAAAAARSI